MDRPDEAPASAVPERWLRVAVAGLTESESDWVGETMVAQGGRAVVEEADGWVTYVPPPDDPAGWVRALEDALARAVGRVVPVCWSWQEHRDWESLWRVGLEPRRVGRRLVVAPTWTDPDTSDHDVLLRIDPGMAFGTAEHATTRVALALVEQAVSSGEHVLDVGTGSAILAIAAARLGAVEVLGIEMDPYACAEAAENTRRNGVDDRVRIVARSFEPEDDWGRFEGVVSNMVSGRLQRALPGLLRALQPAGWLILSGCELHEADAMEALVAEHGLTLNERRTDEGWWGGLFRSS